ncbi:MAG: TMEM165/GDT1 family protein [Promethearchaeati archaeon]
MNFIILFTVFGILFLGELGDKSQLIIFNLVLEMDKKPYKIGIGATLGFAAIVTLGIIFGNLILQFIPVTIIAIISGGVFIIIGIIETRKLKSLYHEMKVPIGNAKKIEKKESSGNDTKTLAFEKFRKNPY